MQFDKTFGVYVCVCDDALASYLCDEDSDWVSEREKASMARDLSFL